MPAMQVLVFSKAVSFVCCQKQRLTCCVDEAGIMNAGEQWIGQVSEKLLQQARDTVHIVTEVLRIFEVNPRGICYLVSKVSSLPTLPIL